ncbi:MAG: MarR family transcriptional regulator, partial [Halobacteriales archaeon]|nr:MarR family transcriptional regulator [Halobacteriales archaeon]
ITRSLEDMGVIEKYRGGYVLTHAGEEVREAASTFGTNVRTALRLGPVLEAVRNITPALDLEALADVTVTTSEQGDIHSPMNRFIHLVERTDSLCGIDINSITPLYIMDIRERILDGMTVEVVMRPVVVASFLAELPDEIIEVCDSSHVTIYLHDDPPCGIAIGDDRVQIGVRDGVSGAVSMSVDTDSPHVREWAETLLESYRENAVRMGTFSPWGLRRAMKDGGFDVAETVDD